MLAIIPILSLGQKVGGPIFLKTIYNSVYYGTIEKIDSNGCFFKNKKERVLYLKNLENDLPKEISNVVKEPEKNYIKIDKLGSYVGEEIIIFLKDGRELKGKIIKISYKIDVFGDQLEVVKFLNSKNKMNILTSEIKKVHHIK